MKHVTIVILVLLAGCLDANATSADSLFFKVKAAYDELQCKDTEMTEEKYLRAFPENVYEFVIWEQQMTDSRSSYDVLKYVQALGRLFLINDTLYCQKLINLSVGASLDADGLNYLRSILHKKIKDEKLSGIFLHLLSEMTVGEQLRFWQYYWSSLSFREEVGQVEDKDAEKELSLLLKKKGVSKAMRRIIRLAFKYSSCQVYFVSAYHLHS